MNLSVDHSLKPGLKLKHIHYIRRHFSWRPPTAEFRCSEGAPKECLLICVIVINVQLDWIGQFVTSNDKLTCSFGQLLNV